MPAYIRSINKQQWAVTNRLYMFFYEFTIQLEYFFIEFNIYYFVLYIPNMTTNHIRIHSSLSVHSQPRNIYYRFEDCCHLKFKFWEKYTKFIDLSWKKKKLIHLKFLECITIIDRIVQVCTVYIKLSFFDSLVRQLSFVFSNRHFCHFYKLLFF